KTATLIASGTQQFAATVTGTSNTAVTWAVIAGPGTINASGLYTAPASIPTGQTATVRVTSVADTSKSDTATVNLTPTIAVTVSPKTANLTAGLTQQFAASVTGTSNTSVTWAVIAGPGTIDASGLYTAPASIPTAQTATVRATSVAD